jgi:hypothetical protein
MRTWTTRGTLVTRRRFERRLDEMFGCRKAERVMLAARQAGLVSTGHQGVHYDRPLLPRERAALILVMGLVAGTNLRLAEATALIVRRPDWLRNAMAVAVTGEDLVLHHAVSRLLTVEVTISNAVLRDPEFGVAGLALALEAA